MLPKTRSFTKNQKVILISEKIHVDKELLTHVADVARLRLTDEEIEKFIPQIEEILEQFSLLSKVDTDGCEPSFQPVKLKQALRGDIPNECLTQEEALSNSKHNKDGYFKGPKAV